MSSVGASSTSGASKIMAHLMFGVALTVDQLLRLVT